MSALATIPDVGPAYVRTARSHELRYGPARDDRCSCGHGYSFGPEARESSAAWAPARAEIRRHITDTVLAEFDVDPADIFDDLVKAAKAAAKRRGKGEAGRSGGWIYRDGRPIVQGWAGFGGLLMGRGIVRVEDVSGRHLGRWIVTVPR